jgi:ubiquinone/menaquinone biosynthesis C-methylase UbiE
METSMNDPKVPNAEQITLWNGPGGHAWVATQSLLDALFKPFEKLLVERAVKIGARHVLDVGCGTGGTTLAVAPALGVQSHSTGIDVSQPMIDAARSRAHAQNVDVQFICGDAQVYPFEPGRFDMIISRFGVMFFDDPIQAFSNLRRASNHDAELRLIVWRSADENPFMTTAERAARSIVPEMPARDHNAPGQFAFADADRVTEMLEKSGWSEIDIQPLDVLCSFAEKSLISYFTQLGPLSRVLREVDDKTRARIIDTVRAAFEPFVHKDEVRFNAACWSVGARASGSTGEAP